MNILTLVFITKLKFRVDVLGVPFRNLDLDSRGSEDNPDRNQALVFGDINLGMVAEELSDVDSGHFYPRRGREFLLMLNLETIIEEERFMAG